MTGNIDMGLNTILNVAPPAADRDAATKAYADGKEFRGDMKQAKIVNLAEPTSETDAATKSYADDKVHQFSITSVGATNVFHKWMEDEDESSSESNITVSGIFDFAGSPHEFNKKAYSFKITKTGNRFVGRLGFNFFSLPEGEFTICLEFFPALMTGASVNCVSTALNVKRQASKTFPADGMIRAIVHVHKWQISPPEFLMVDMHWTGTSSSPTEQAGHLIVYGVRGDLPDVPANVFDSPFSFENQRMVMQTNLDMNGHNLSGSKIAETGVFQKRHDSHKFLFIGSTSRFLFFPSQTKLVEVGLFHASIKAIPRIDLTFSMSVNNRKFERILAGSASRSLIYDIGDGIEIPSMTNFSFSPQEGLVIGLDDKVYLSLVFEIF